MHGGDGNESKTCKAKFYTVISRDGIEGEMDPDFAKQYQNELQQCLKFVDTDNNVSHIVFYNMDTNRPRFTTGWAELRKFYKFSEEHHPIWLWYYGSNLFEFYIAPFPKLYNSLIPEYHTLYGVDRDSIQFDVVVPNVELKGAKLEMSMFFMECIRKYDHSYIRVIGDRGIILSCNIIEVRRCHLSVKVDKSWKEMFVENGFVEGDILRFIPRGLSSCNLVRVEKKSREECFFGDDSDLIYHPGLRDLYLSD